MGNQACYSYEEPKKNECIPKRTKRANEIKKKVKNAVINGAKALEIGCQKTEMLEMFLDFFKNTLIEVINKYEFPKPGKDFLQAGYVLSFVNINDITQQIKKDDADVDSQLLKNLMDNINELQEKSLFYLILKEFNEFYKQLLTSKKEKLDDNTITPHLRQMSDTKSFIRTQLPLEIQEKQLTFEIEDCFISRNKLNSLMKQDDHLIDYLIISVTNLFEILKQIICLTYTEIIQEFISLNDIQKYLQNSLFFQKLIQHYIYDKEFCIGQLIEKIVPLKYSNEQIQYEGQIIERQQTLDISLYPEPGQQTIIKGFEEDIFAHDNGRSRQEFYFRSSSRMSIIEMQTQILNAISQIENQNLPYKELFIILKQMFEEVKPYRIFLLIQKLSDDIVDIYLQSRPQDQQNKYRELILAEDNKLSIILFLLHKFQDQSKCNLNRLFYKLRFMMDYNEVLDNRIKYEMDQSFVRFYACLEMIIQTP